MNNPYIHEHTIACLQEDLRRVQEDLAYAENTEWRLRGQVTGLSAEVETLQGEIERLTEALKRVHNHGRHDPITGECIHCEVLGLVGEPK